MPLLHRLATLRDDVIFFVYLYQAWKYKVDHTRVNEFGQGGDDEEVEEKVAGQPLKAPAAVAEKGSVERWKEAEGLVEKTDQGLGKVDAAVSSGVQKGGAKKRKA